MTQPILVEDLRHGSDPLVSQNGELAAYDKKDLLNAISVLISAGQNGKVMNSTEAASAEQTAKNHSAMISAAFDSNEELAALGDVIAGEIRIVSDRDGFARRLMAYQPLEDGQAPQVRLRTKNCVASVATGPTQVNTQIIRDNMIYPAEFYITARPYIEQRDLSRSGVDLVEEKYFEALESAMVEEDRTWKSMVDSIIGVDNHHLNIGGVMTPTALSRLKSTVTDWGLPANTWLIASDLWTDITTDPGFQRVIDPVSQYNVLMTGKLGRIYDMDIISDQHRHPSHKVLSRGEQYIIAEPRYHGQYTDRGGITAQIIDGTQEKIPGRGWFMSQTMSMVIGNPRSVARATRTLG